MDSADVAIVGGGVIGWSVAFHLKRRAPRLSIAVIERHPSAGMGSTGRAAGGVRAQFGTPVNVDLSLASIREFEVFGEEVGADIAFRQYGYLLVTARDKGVAFLEASGEMQRGRGVPVEALDLEEVRRRAPYIECSDLLAGAFSPTDGYLDPYAVCRGYEAAARKLGVSALYRREVVAVGEGRVAFRSSEGDGELACREVVLACGHKSARLARTAGLELPVEPTLHQLALTEAVSGLPERLPMVVDLDTSFHFRREGEGLLVGFNDDRLEADPEADDTGFDYGFLERMAPAGLRRLPLLADVGFDTRRGW